jgi:hypothetical protein
MAEITEALRLADELEGKFPISGKEAAAELRRLDELAESEGRWASDYLARAVKAEALNSQLLEALEFPATLDVAGADDRTKALVLDAVLWKVRAAIVAAKGGA